MELIILGAGKQAEKHARAFRAAGVDPIYVVDQDPSRSRALAEQLDLKTLSLNDFDRVGLSQAAAVVATPTPTHAELVARCLEAGFHCLCEKPLAMNAQDARLLAQRAREKNLVGMVGYLYRHAPTFSEGRRLYRMAVEDPTRGPLGRLVYGWFRLGGRGSHRDWKHRRAAGGGALREMGVHMLDLLLWYAGALHDVRVIEHKILRSQRLIESRHVAADAEDMVLACGEDEQGRLFYIACDLLSPGFVQYVELEGEEGTFWGSIEPDRPSYVHSLTGGGDYPKGRTNLPSASGDLYLRQAQAFLEAIVKPRATIAATFDESVVLHHWLDQLEVVLR